MSDKYILNGKTPKPADLMEWAKWYETADLHVAKDAIGDVRISTVFLGLDHSFGSGPPLIFETMIFGGAHDQHQTRASTWDEAEKQHAEAVAMVKGTIDAMTGKETECEHSWLYTADLTADEVNRLPDGLATFRASGRHCMKCGKKEKIENEFTVG